jgi:arylsulfatase A-like enzyme
LSARARVAALTVVACAGAAAWWSLGRHGATALPAEIVIEDTVAELSQSLDGSTVVTQAPGDPVRVGEVRPGNRLAGHGERPSIVAPPTARVRRVLDVPRGGVLRFGVGVQGDGRRDPERSGIRFAVSVDGREVWHRTLNPAATRHDRRWFDERVDLAPAAGRRVEVELVTEAERPDRPASGTPGWGGVRLVRETNHARQTASPAAPNVLVLLVDTLRADGLGCYGATPSPSPNLDRLAAQGLVFAQAIAQSSWTLPSVASLFTGLHPRSHGAIGDDGGNPDAAWGYLADGVVTWAEQASRAGITTVGVSANPLISRGTNLAQGFETFAELPWDAKARRWGAAAEINRTFLEWLAPNRGHRFVAWLHYMEPHDPYTPPDALRPPVPPGAPPDVAAGWVLDVSRRLGKPGAPALPPEQLAYLRALYRGEIRSWDAQLPALLAGLERLGVRDSTLVIVTADHGEEFLEHGLLLHRAHLYDEVIRVPLVVVGPGVTPGRRIDQVQGIDLFPTLADVLGLDATAQLPGRNLLAPAPGRSAFVATDGQANDGTRRALEAVRQPDWKLIHAPVTDDFQLFDLGADPGEQTPLDVEAGHGPALRLSLEDFARTAPPPPARTGHDPALGEKLRALGYAE